MGCKFSHGSTSAVTGVRVVHINGFVEDYPAPITVREVTGKPPKLACFSPAQLLSFNPRPLGVDDPLEPGRLYFLLPHTLFRSDSSPVDLAALVTRLTAVARNAGGVPAPADPKPKMAPSGSGRVDSPGGQRGVTELAGEPEIGGQYAYIMGGSNGGRGARACSWKPILDTIEERSLGRSMRSLSSRSSSTH